MMPLLSAKGLTKRFGARVACRDVGRLALAKDFGVERIYRLERIRVNDAFVIKDSCESATR